MFCQFGELLICFFRSTDLIGLLLQCFGPSEKIRLYGRARWRLAACWGVTLRPSFCRTRPGLQAGYWLLLTRVGNLLFAENKFYLGKKVFLNNKRKTVNQIDHWPFRCPCPMPLPDENPCWDKFEVVPVNSCPLVSVLDHWEHWGMPDAVRNCEDLSEKVKRTTKPSPVEPVWHGSGRLWLLQYST
jgi:hypothetical protein